MFYLWVHYENQYRDFYLPDQKNWVSVISLHPSDTGWDQDIAITVRALDGRWFIRCAGGYTFKDYPSDVREVEIAHGLHLNMRQGNSRSVGFIFNEYEKAQTEFIKYLFTGKQTVTIGRNPECIIRYDENVVSGEHGHFSRKADGVCEYTDGSKNGTYLNGVILKNATVRLKYADTIALTPGLKIVYLGNMLAISQTRGLASVRLDLAGPPDEGPQKDLVSIPSVYIEYHRRPRILQQPDLTPYEIEPPIQKNDSSDDPLWLTVGPSATMVLPMLAGTVISGAASGAGDSRTMMMMMASGLAMVVTSSILAVGWGLVNSRYRKKRMAEAEERRTNLYFKYIAETEQTLTGLRDTEYRRLMRSYMNATECLHLLTERTHRLWERTPAHYDFMSLRLGLGSVPLSNPLATQQKKLSLIDDPLRDEPQRLINTYGTVENAPVTVSLREEAVIGILGADQARTVAQGLLLQLAALHSYHDVKIIVLADDAEITHWAWTRWLPHAFASEDRSLRMVVSKPEAIHTVLSHLDEILIRRGESAAEREADNADGDELPLPHYVIFCTDFNILDDHPIMRRLLAKPLGMSLVLIAPTMEMLLKECRQVLDTTSETGMLYTAKGNVMNLALESANPLGMEAFARRLAQVRVKDAVESSAIPTLVTFLELYGVKRVEELDVWRLWSENHAYEGLRSTVGLRSGSLPFVLNISDKYHGPHGLIAGTTGSGKSVMLETYILSLALNYHPLQVQFVLIDYKGGGTSDTFRNLPHVTGIVDNLQSARIIDRALRSLQGEIHRRERIFKTVGVTNIDEYIRLFWDDPNEVKLSHLIIIVDEFAELKRDQPEFMRELISASAVGRSLGIHLILSTQKPSNSVDDTIWANSRFRICLRVESPGDSRDMLKRTDAAYIKAKGRCFVQIGNDEIFEEVQTSWSGATYRPDEPRPEEKPQLLDEAGQPITIKKKKISAEAKEVTEMDAVLGRISAVFKEQKLPSTRMLWMPELKETIMLTEIELFNQSRFAQGRWLGADDGLSVVYGLADDVANQLYIPAVLDLLVSGNIALVGKSATGKTTLVQTLAMAFACKYAPDQLNIYVLSSSRVLNCLKELPHVGDVIFGDEIQEQHRFIDMLDAEIEHRNKLFAQASTDNFTAYNRSQRANGDAPVPAIIVFIDRIGQFRDTLSEEHYERLLAMIGEGRGRGVFFIATALALNEIHFRAQDHFRGIALQPTDRGDCSDILKKRMPASDEMSDIAPIAGRAAVVLDNTIYEIQIALFGTSADDAERARQIAETGREMSAACPGASVPHVPRIPEKVAWVEFSETTEFKHAQEDPWMFPVGYDFAGGLPKIIHLDESFSFLVVGPKRSGKTNFLKVVAETFAARGAQIHIVATEETWSATAERLHATLYTDVTDEKWMGMVDSIKSQLDWRTSSREDARAGGRARYNEVTRTFRPVVLIFDDLHAFIDQLDPADAVSFGKMVANTAQYGLYLFFATSQQGYTNMQMKEPVYTLTQQQRGIALGGKLNDFDPWNIPTSVVGYQEKTLPLPLGQAYFINNGDVSKLVIPLATKDDERGGASKLTVPLATEDDEPSDVSEPVVLFATKDDDEQDV